MSPGGDVPSGVRDVVRRRLARLPESTQRLLGIAAVVGRDVELALLARAAGQDIESVVDDLDPAVVQRLLVPVPELPGTVRFSHALVREVVVDDVSALRRARTHLRIADAIAETAAGDDDAAEILAEHLWAAAPVGVGRRAAEALERAAEVAVRRFAFEAAEGMLERAVQLRRSAAGAADGVQPELTAACRLLSLQRSLHGYASVGDSALLRRAIELARRAGDDEVLAASCGPSGRPTTAGATGGRRGERLHALGGRPTSARPGGGPGVARRGPLAPGASPRRPPCSTPPSRRQKRAAGVSMGLDLGSCCSRSVRPPPAVLVSLGPPEACGPFRRSSRGARPLRRPDHRDAGRGGALLVGSRRGPSRPPGRASEPTERFTFWGRGLQGTWRRRVELGDVRRACRSSGGGRHVRRAGGRTGVPVYLASRAAGLVAAGRLGGRGRGRRRLRSRRWASATPSRWCSGRGPAAPGAATGRRGGPAGAGRREATAQGGGRGSGSTGSPAGSGSSPGPQVPGPRSAPAGSAVSQRGRDAPRRAGDPPEAPYPACGGTA